MKLTLIDISWRAASPAAKLPRNSGASNEYLEYPPFDERALTHLGSDALTLFDALALGRNQSAPKLRQGEVKRNKGETAREIMHAPCRLAFSSIVIQRSAEDDATPAIVA